MYKGKRGTVSDYCNNIRVLFLLIGISADLKVIKRVNWLTDTAMTIHNFELSNTKMK